MILASSHVFTGHICIPFQQNVFSSCLPIFKLDCLFSYCWALLVQLLILKKFTNYKKLQKCRDFLCTLHLDWPNDNILHNLSTLSKPENWHWHSTVNSGIDLIKVSLLFTHTFSCIILWNFITCVNLYTHHENQDTKLFHLK